MPNPGLRSVPPSRLSPPSRRHGTLTSPFAAQRDIFVSLPHRGLCHVVWIPRFESSPMPFSRRFVTKQVEEALQPNADGAFRGDGDHVRAVDHILDCVSRRHFSGHQGMVQRARSCDTLSANLAADAQCYSSCQRQYKLYLTIPSLCNLTPPLTFFG
jgi:hypothetical protein